MGNMLVLAGIGSFRSTRMQPAGAVGVVSCVRLGGWLCAALLSTLTVSGGSVSAYRPIILSPIQQEKSWATSRPNPLMLLGGTPLDHRGVAFRGRPISEGLAGCASWVLRTFRPCDSSLCRM